MTNELTKKEKTSLFDPSLIKKAQENSGSLISTKIPYISTLTINNKEIEEQDENGDLIIRPAKKGFNLTLKEDGKYFTDFYCEGLSATILKVRYAISSKRTIEPRFYSFEFDNFWNPIAVYDENKKVLIEAPYREIKEFFATGEMNSLGKPKTSFNLDYILYINLSNEIYKLKLNQASVSNFIDYTKSFGENDTYVRYLTLFNLKYNTIGKVRFWNVNFEKGSSVQLEEQIQLQEKLNEFLMISKAVKEKKINSIKEEVIEYPKEEKEVIDISQIPF